MSAGLLSLSNNDISLISKYCTIDDLSRLDVAYCNHSERDEYLAIISDNSCIAYDHVKFDLYFKHVNNALIWIGNRKIKVSALSVGLGEYSNTVHLTNDGLIGLSEHCSLQSLQISGCKKVTDSGIIAIVRTCSLLKSLNISDCEKITDAGITEIVTQCQQLECLDTSWCKISDAGITAIGRRLVLLKSLDISGCGEITNAGIAEIAKCKHLESLYICGCEKITNTGITEIAKCASLKSLNANDCNKITNTGIAEIAKKCPKLNMLSIGGCHRITDAGIAEMARNFRSLQSLTIDVGDTGLTQIALNCSELRSLNACCNDSLTDSGITQIALNCRKLENLDVSYCNNISDTGITQIARHCSELQSLEIRRNAKIMEETLMSVFSQMLNQNPPTFIPPVIMITDVGMSEIARNCAGLKSLTISDCDGFTDAGLSEIVRHCTQLERLDISHSKTITDAGLIEISKHCRSLQYLNADYCMITDTGVTEVVKLRSLRSLCMRLCKNLSNISMSEIGCHGTQLESLSILGCDNIDDTSVDEVCRLLPKLRIQANNRFF